MTITIYTTSDCAQYRSIYMAFDRKGTNYQLVDLRDNEQALYHIKALGYEQVSVIQTTQEHWSGFRPDKINSLFMSQYRSVGV